MGSNKASMPPIKITPSILSADLAKLGAEVHRVGKAGADCIHFDVMDGHFVPPISYGDIMLNALRKRTSLPIDAHLMVEHPESQVLAYCQAGADYVTIHAEATPHLHRVLQVIRSHKSSDAASGERRNIKTGVALNPGTSYTIIPESLIRDGLIDMILQMTVNPGWGGQEFIVGALDNVRYFRDSFPDLDIQVDGGIGYKSKGKELPLEETTAYLAARAGANILVAGSAVFKEQDYSHSITTIRAATELGMRHCQDKKR